MVGLMITRPGLSARAQQQLGLLDYCTTSIFLLEMVLKISVVGLWHGPEAYLRNAWDVSDGLLVVSTIFEWIVTVGVRNSQHGPTRLILRLLRPINALRPLRLVRRMPQLRETVQSLVNSLRPLLSVAVICSMGFLLFAILGVQLFKGQLYRCSVTYVGHASPTATEDPLIPDYSNITTTAPVPNDNTTLASIMEDLPSTLDTTQEAWSSNGSVNTTAGAVTEALRAIKTKEECLVYGGQWMRDEYNFDNVGQALITLFAISSRDGWVDIMYRAVDSRDEHRQPQLDNNPAVAWYFVFFLLSCSYFALNMFVGVLVESFQRAMPLHDGLGVEKQGQSATDVANSLVGARFFACWACSPLKCAAPVQNLFQHPLYETGLSLSATASVLLCLAHYHGQSQEDGRPLSHAMYGFCAVYVVAALAKNLVCFRQLRRAPWMQIDLFLALTGLVELGAGPQLHHAQGAGVATDALPVFIAVTRAFRILRLLRLLPTSVRLLQTAAASVGQVASLTLLLGLIFFMAAAMGVELFGRLGCRAVRRLRESTVVLTEPVRLSKDPRLLLSFFILFFLAIVQGAWDGVTHGCSALGRHANFDSIGAAALTLFRVASGDNWVEIMQDTLRQSPLCDSSDTCETNCCALIWLTPMYFVVFVVLTQFIMLNVVVVSLKHACGVLEERFQRPSVVVFFLAALTSQAVLMKNLAGHLEANDRNRRACIALEKGLKSHRADPVSLNAG